MNLLLIDLSSIAHAQFHLSGSEPDPDWTAKRTVARVHALASGMPSGVAVAIDSPPYFRKDIDPAYKANRTTDHVAVVSHQIKIAIDALKADGFPVWGVKGYEADDIIATAVRMANGKFIIEPVHERDEWSVLIASSDKDLLQLVSDRVSIKSLKNGSIIGPDETRAKFGVWPHQMVDYLSLVGDTSDNVPGAKGVGGKRAADLLELFGNLDDAFTAINSGQHILTPSMTQSMLDFETRLASVRSLIRLRTDAPIPFEDIFKERVPVATDGDMAFASDHEETMTDTVDKNAVVGYQGGSPIYHYPPEAADERRDAMDDTRPAEAVATPAAEAPSPNADNDRYAITGRLASVAHDARPPDVERHAADSPSTGGPAGAGSVVAASNSALVRQGVIVDQLAPLPDDWRHQLEPRSVRQLKDMSLDIAASKHYSHLGSASGVLATIAAGRELGMHMMASLRAFHIIEGKPAMSAGLIRALVMQSPLCEYLRIVERTPERATWVTKRKGDPEVSLTYTLAEGRAAWQKDQKAWDASAWGKRSTNMVTKTGATEICRLVYPDVVMNLYSVEEFGGEDVSS